MQKKMLNISWGTGVMVVFIAFAAMMVTLVVKSNRTHFDLVTKDYYQEELAYQEKIDAMNNVMGLKSGFQWKQNEKNLILSIPEELKAQKINGECWFYFPSDARMDVRIPLNMNGKGEQYFSKKEFRPGAYQVKLSCEVKGVHYYVATMVNID